MFSLAKTRHAPTGAHHCDRSADARYALRAAVDLDDTAEGLDFSNKTNRCFLAADVKKDETILAEDARLILRASVGLETLG